MRPSKLDHVALFLEDPESAARALVSRLPFRVIERGDDFVLVGRASELGKITLFEADGARESGVLVGLGVGIPGALETTRIELADGLAVTLARAEDPTGEIELDLVALAVPDPASSARRWRDFGFEQEASADGVERVRLGNAVVELHPGRLAQTDRPYLNHLGLLVDSIDDVRRSVSEHDFDVTREVEGENSLALFVRGPDGVEIEYIEHKPSFALA